MEAFFAVVIIILVLGVSLHINSPAFKGSRGEVRVNKRLNSSLDEQEYHVLRDLTLPTKGGTTQIDHVVVSRFGIFVIETKNMKGWIFGSANQARWTQTLHRYKSQFQNPLRQNYKHIKVIEELLGIQSQQLHNVVAFVGSAVPRTDMPENVLWSDRELAAYIKSKRSTFFEQNDVLAFVNRLNNNALEASRQTNRDHVRNLNNRANAPAILPSVSALKNSSTRCPRCRSSMVERSNRKSGQKFFGCSQYPKCRGTLKAR